MTSSGFVVTAGGGRPVPPDRPALTLALVPTTTPTVVDWAGQRAIVQLDHPTGRFTTGEIRCPPLGLDRLPT